MKKVKLVFYGVMSLISILTLIYFLTSIFYGRAIDGIETPSLLGNREDNIGRINEDQILPKPFSFLVVSDTRSSSIFEAFYNASSYPKDLDFTIIGGDFVKNPEREYHNYFISEFAEWGLKKPVFLIVGNHEIAVKEEDKEKVNVFSLDDYRRTYGPLNFYFKYSGCLFIGINDNYNDTYVDYLREILSTQSDGALMKFVFMHIPPPSLMPVKDYRPLEREGDFFDAIDKYKVDYVISSDYHSYLRYHRKDTNYIITGGGGAHLYDNSSSFYHAILLKVDPKKKEVAEFIYPLYKPFDFSDSLEISMVAKTYPFFKYHRLLGAAILALNAIIVVLFVWRFFLILRRWD